MSRDRLIEKMEALKVNGQLRLEFRHKKGYTTHIRRVRRLVEEGKVKGMFNVTGGIQQGKGRPVFLVAVTKIA